MPSQRELIRERKAQQARQARTIQWVGAGAIVLLIAAVVWQVMPKGQTETPVVAVGDQPACDIFSDIPAATQYDTPPQRVDAATQYFATVKMAKGGEFVLQL